MYRTIVIDRKIGMVHMYMPALIFSWSSSITFSLSPGGIGMYVLLLPGFVCYVGYLVRTKV
jgi:hypothetical protein